MENTSVVVDCAKEEEVDDDDDDDDDVQTVLVESMVVSKNSEVDDVDDIDVAIDGVLTAVFGARVVKRVVVCAHTAQNNWCGVVDILPSPELKSKLFASLTQQPRGRAALSWWLSV